MGRRRKKYHTSLEHMKEYKEETYKKRNKDLINKLNRKESLLITSLENKQKIKKKKKKKQFLY